MTGIAAPTDCSNCHTADPAFELVEYATVITEEGRLLARYKFRCNKCGMLTGNGVPTQTPIRTVVA